jgi:prophage regulatory protein
MTERFIAMKEIPRLTSLSRSQIYRLIKDGDFPRPVALGSRKAYLESEIIAWQTDRIAERDAA